MLIQPCFLSSCYLGKKGFLVSANQGTHHRFIAWLYPYSKNWNKQYSDFSLLFLLVIKKDVLWLNLTFWIPCIKQGLNTAGSCHYQYPTSISSAAVAFMCITLYPHFRLDYILLVIYILNQFFLVSFISSLIWLKNYKYLHIHTITGAWKWSKMIT